MLPQVALRSYTGIHHWRSKEEHASGRLCLQAYCPYWLVTWSKRWREAKPGTFASMIPSIVSELEDMAPGLAGQLEQANLQAEEKRRTWEEERRQREIEAERVRREEARQQSRKELMAAIASWDEVRRVRAYFESVEAEIGSLPEEDAVLVRERLRLARELIGQLDPLALLRHWSAPDER